MSHLVYKRIGVYWTQSEKLSIKEKGLELY
jgi:hypothetical protein